MSEPECKSLLHHLQLVTLGKSWASFSHSFFSESQRHVTRPQGLREDSVRCHGTMSGTRRLLDQGRLPSLLECPGPVASPLGLFNELGSRRTQESALPGQATG